MPENVMNMVSGIPAHGIDAFFPILRGVVTLEEAMKNENAKRNLADTAEQVYRTFTIL